MIKGPKNAVPTRKGWVNPKTGELLKSQRISQAQIDRWKQAQPGKTPKVEVPVKPEPVVEANYAVVEQVIDNETITLDEIMSEDNSEVDYESMTRAELLEIAEQRGVEVPGFRPTKRTIIEALQD